LTSALLGTGAVTGTLKWERRRIVRYAVVTTVLTIVVIGGTRALFGRVLKQEYTKDQVLTEMHLRRQAAPATVHRTPPALTLDRRDEGQLEGVRTRGVLRVGYVPDALPFAFFNARDELVGFDIEMAHNLASELGLRLEFLPVDRTGLEEQMNGDYCDIVMSGVAVTTSRASRILFSSVYLDETLAFLVRDGDRDKFSSWDQIRALGAITLVAPNLPYYIDKIRERLPRAKMKIVPDVASALTQQGEFDAIALPAERGSAWTLLSLYPSQVL
jgi:ABC-type amino acid transport substrate-binding protein